MMGRKKATKAVKKATKKDTKVRFFAEHFWKLIEQQNGKCALSGRELTPDNTEVELREPYKADGRTDFENHYLIVRPLAFMARYLSVQEIVDICEEVVEFRDLDGQDRD